jgi:DinB superfamily
MLLRVTVFRVPGSSRRLDESDNSMSETAQQYTERLLSYSAAQDPLELLQAAPSKVAALINGRSKEELTRRPAPDKWSVGQIVAHLADAEIAISWRLRQILSTNAVAIDAYDQDLWANTFHYEQRDPQQSLAAYRALRESNIVLLKSVDRKLWDNYGVHSERGNESIHHMTKMTSGHDLNHIRQIEAILGQAHATAG